MCPSAIRVTIGNSANASQNETSILAPGEMVKSIATLGPVEVQPFPGTIKTKYHINPQIRYEEYRNAKELVVLITTNGVALYMPHASEIWTNRLGDLLRDAKQLK